MKQALFALAAVFVAVGATHAADKAGKIYDPHMEKNKIVVMMEFLDPQGGNKPAGEVVITETPYGLVFTPFIMNAQGQTGVHGFHIHMNPDCGADAEGKAGMKAGGHWDPAKTGMHSFPWDNRGHKGDLPALFVDNMGNTPNPVLAPKLKKLDEIKGRSLMVHFGGDNHHDMPKALGGGGARMACGVIK